MVIAQILAGGDEEAAGAACRIADHVIRRGLCQFDHQPDDMARRAELAVLAGRCDLAEHVFVEIALGVAILQRDLRQHVDHLGQQAGRGDGEARALHVFGMGRAFLCHIAQEGKDVFRNNEEHTRRIIVPEARPAQHGIGDFFLDRARLFVAHRAIDAIRKDHSLDRPAQHVGLVLLAGLDVIETAHEQKVGDLLDHLERIGDAAGPEGIPDLIDLRANFTVEHA